MKQEINFTDEQMFDMISMSKAGYPYHILVDKFGISAPTIKKKMMSFENYHNVIPARIIFEEEEFFKIPKFQGYKASRTGKILGQSNNLMTAKNINGYDRITMVINGKIKTKFVHTLVALTFIKKVPGKPKINHKDGVKTNNNVENLEWCTQMENIHHAWTMGLSTPSYGNLGKTKKDKPGFKKKKYTSRVVSEAVADDIFSRYISGQNTSTELREEYNLKPSQIGNILSYKKKEQI